MNLVRLCFLFLAFVTTPVLAQTPSSLFFSENETRAIESEAQKISPKTTTINDDSIHLGAVFYYSPTNWTLWLQGERWTPQTHNPRVQIKFVSPNTVRLAVVRSQGEVVKEITLRPHQTYHFSTEEMTEGDRN